MLKNKESFIINSIEIYYMKTVLVDMDGVIVDYDKGFLDIFREKHPNEPFLSLEERRSCSVELDYPEYLTDKIRDITNAPGFFMNLPAIDGAIEALFEMSKYAEVYICTSPSFHNPTCASDKFNWMLKNFNMDWAKRTIVTRCKWQVKGDYLIDDKPWPYNEDQASWEHILYNRPYNGHIAKRRVDWYDWKFVLGEELGIKF